MSAPSAALLDDLTERLRSTNIALEHASHQLEHRSRERSQKLRWRRWVNNRTDDTAITRLQQQHARHLKDHHHHATWTREQTEISRHNEHSDGTKPPKPESSLNRQESMLSEDPYPVPRPPPAPDGSRYDPPPQAPRSPRRISPPSEGTSRRISPNTGNTPVRQLSSQQNGRHMSSGSEGGMAAALLRAKANAINRINGDMPRSVQQQSMTRGRLPSSESFRSQSMSSDNPDKPVAPKPRKPKAHSIAAKQARIKSQLVEETHRNISHISTSSVYRGAASRVVSNARPPLIEEPEPIPAVPRKLVVRRARQGQRFGGPGGGGGLRPTLLPRAPMLRDCDCDDESHHRRPRPPSASGRHTAPPALSPPARFDLSTTGGAHTAISHGATHMLGSTWSTPPIPSAPPPPPPPPPQPAPAVSGRETLRRTLQVPRRPASAMDRLRRSKATPRFAWEHQGFRARSDTMSELHSKEFESPLMSARAVTAAMVYRRNPTPTGERKEKPEKRLPRTTHRAVEKMKRCKAYYVSPYTYNPLFSCTRCPCCEVRYSAEYVATMTTRYQVDAQRGRWGLEPSQGSHLNMPEWKYALVTVCSFCANLLRPATEAELSPSSSQSWI